MSTSTRQLRSPEHGEYDPHTWISPALAKQQAQKIYEAFVRVDPSHSGYYAQRWASLSAKFDSLDQGTPSTFIKDEEHHLRDPWRIWIPR
jgi:ABC-type Zn uptake system ZnuABC Zn-binding protein ZnuA